MKATRYLEALERLERIERSRWERIRQEYLVRYFSGCGCRQHNCLVNFESGVSEGPNHAFLAQKSREYNFQVRRHSETFERLKKSLWTKHCRLAFGFNNP